MATFDVGIIFTAVNNAKGAFSSMNRDLKKTETQGKKTAKSLRAIQVVLAGIAIGSGVAFAKTITKTVGEMELLVIRLGQVEGGMTAARQTLARMTDEFAKTPFAIDAVANGFTRLRAAGLGTEEAFDTLRAGVDAVAAFGGSTQELNRFIIGLQQSIGKGTLSMEELRQQIGEAVPSAMRVLAREMDISIGELFTRIESGSVDSLDAIKDLTRGLTEDFGGVAKKLGNKILGALQGVQSDIRVALEEMFNVDTNAGQQTVSFIEQMGAAIVRLIKSIRQDEIDRFFTSIRSGARIIGVIVGVFRSLLNVLAEFFNNIQAILGASGTIILVGGVIGAVLFGKFAGAITIIVLSIQQIFSGFEGGAKFAEGVTNTIITGLTFGLMGKAIFGKGGPAILVAAVGTAFTQIGSIIKTNKADRELADNLGKNVARIIGDRGVEAAKEFLKKFIDQGEKQGTAQRIANNLLGRQGTFNKGIENAKKLLAELQAKSGELFDTVNGASAETQKKMEKLTNFVSRNFADTAVKIRRLVSQAETTTFSFGSQTAEKMRRKLIPMVKVVEQLRDKLAKFISDTKGQTLTETEAKALKQARKELQGVEKDLSKINAAIKAGEATGLAKFMEKVRLQANAANRAVSAFGRDLLGNDGLDAAIQSVRDKYASLEDKIGKVIAKMKLANSTSGIAAQNELVQKAVDIRDRLIEKLREQKKIQDEIFALDQKSVRLNIDQDIIKLKRAGRGGLGILTSDFADQADDRKLELTLAIVEAKQKVKQLDLESLEASVARRVEIEATQEKLRELIGAQQEALESTTAAGLLAEKTWKDVGEAIQSTVKGAIKDFINGTGSAEKVLTAFYNKITNAAVEYLFELIKIEFRQKAINAASGGGGGGGGGIMGIFSGIFGGLFAKGGAFKGNVKPFANGDIVRGPTMFGLAGEAGDEAIMPLTRIGGQLGVRATGGGGDQFNITIQAIDTQTGAQFLQRNGPSIVSAMRRQDRLNNGGIR